MIQRKQALAIARRQDRMTNLAPRQRPPMVTRVQVSEGEGDRAKHSIGILVYPPTNVDRMRYDRQRGVPLAYLLAYLAVTNTEVVAPASGGGFPFGWNGERMRTPQHAAGGKYAARTDYPRANRANSGTRRLRHVAVQLMRHHEPYRLLGRRRQDADPLLAYERTPEFRFYLLAKVEWEQTKESYLRGPRTAAAVKAELRAWEYAQTLLELARRTPEHLAAFGY